MGIKQPRWKEPEYTKKQINNAGIIIRNEDSSFDEKEEALKILDNWRAAHAYPLHVFYMNLREKAGSRGDIIVVERLKRLESIVSKLQREDGMKLYRMQDLGGCRMVVPNIVDVYRFSDKFQKSRIRHEHIKTNDYIQHPKLSGYRSLHLIYRFQSDRTEKAIYNKYPMLIELQFRTHLQHIWATALETIGLFTNQALKAGQGNESILRFFALVSSVFAIQEGCPTVPNTSENQEILISEMKKINNQHHILEMLRAIRVAIDHDADTIPNKWGYYILQLNYKEHLLRRIYFKPSELALANSVYDSLEEMYRDAPVDVVLVRAASYATVKAAYPNYFMDIGEFVNRIEWLLTSHTKENSAPSNCL